MDELMDNVVHVTIAASFVTAVAATVSGFSSGNVEYLNVLTASLTIALLASILYVAEQILSDMDVKAAPVPKNRKRKR
jgi:hypothetical protein